MLRKLSVLLSMILVAALLRTGPQRPAAAAGGLDAFVAYLAVESSLSQRLGPGRSGMQVQNLDPALEAQITVEIFPQDGGPAFTRSIPNVAPGSAANLYTGFGFKTGDYAAKASADRRIGAIARTDWWTTGAAALNGDAVPGTEVFVPLVAKAYFGQTSFVFIQNTDTQAPATVTIELYGQGSTGALLRATKAIGPGTSITLDMGTDPAFASLAAGSLFSMVVTSAGKPVDVQVFMAIDGIRGVYAYEGAPPERAASRLYAPLIRNDFGGTTGISVVNPGASAVDVKVTYIGSPLTPACAGLTVHGNGSFSLAPKTSAVFYQGNVASLPTGFNGLPPRCLGTAIIESVGGPVLAIVNDADLGKTANSPGHGTSAAYNAFSDADGGRRLALPLYRKNHVGNTDLSTGIQVMNLGAAPASVRIEIKDDRGRVLPVGTDGLATIPPRGSHTWYPPAMTALPPNSYGSAILTSDQPIIAIVNDASGNGTVDAAIYGGIKAD